MVAKTMGCALLGVAAFPIGIEVSVSPGLHTFITGLPDNVVKESLLRIEIALKNIGLTMPRTKLVISLAPAEVQKSGAGLDLPMALGILAASGQLDNPDALQQYMIMGELGLDGKLQPIKGVLPMAIKARNEKCKGIILPQGNSKEAALVNELKVYGMTNLREVVEFFNNGEQGVETPHANTRETFYEEHDQYPHDFRDVKGQESMKRVLEIAAAGGHNALFIGPPGSSKTMLAKRMPSILPPLSIYEALETTRIYSVAGLLKDKHGLITQRPFQVPHHTISDVALCGGGTSPQPGLISLAHNGILFLDELPEFKRSALEVLRQPIEERKVVISRAKMTLELPADFMLLASMNPCPCGYYHHKDKRCTCAPNEVKKYLAKLSGPLLDRIDLQLKVSPVPFHELDQAQAGESSTQIRARVMKARELQAMRYQEQRTPKVNANMNSEQIQQYCVLDAPSRNLLYKSMEALHLSARAYERILKVCRTIADLAGREKIQMQHVAEAIHYRNLDLHKSEQQAKAERKRDMRLSDEDEVLTRRNHSMFMRKV